MNITQIPLWPNEKFNGEFEPYLELYENHELTSSTCVLILPGGGYRLRADHEGIPVAERFNSLGFSTAVLQYRVAPSFWPDPARDVLRAVQMLRGMNDAGVWKAEKVAVLGFSAGGHLAACSGVFAESVDTLANDAADEYSAKADALILCYPVISSGEFAHVDSFDALTNSTQKSSLREYLSVDKRVDDSTPPTFLWHTTGDNGVPVENSLLFAEAMRRHGREVEIQLFAGELHGIGLAIGSEAEPWSELAAKFLRRQGF